MHKDQQLGELIVNFEVMMLTFSQQKTLGITKQYYSILHYLGLLYSETIRAAYSQACHGDNLKLCLTEVQDSSKLYISY